MNRFKLVATLALALAALPLAAAAEDAPGVFKIPGTESTIKIYGYAQLDATVDFSGRANDAAGYENTDWATALPFVPDDKSAFSKRVKPQTYLTARTSRFGIQTSTPTKLGNVGVKVEGDFNGPNSFQSESYTNSVVFRLRHAYGTVGGFLAGQTWSTFLDLNAAPDTVDFNGPGTLALVRNPMLKYTADFGSGMNLALALENTRGPQFDNHDTRYQTIPDAHANFGYAGSWGTVSARAVLQTFNRAAVSGGAYQDVSPKHKEGVAFAVSGSLKVSSDTLVWQFSGGPGAGRYVLNAANWGGVVTDANGDLKLVSVYGVHAGYTHVWGPEFRSNVIGAYTWVQDPKAGGVAATNASQKDFIQVFANTFWTFAKNAEFGVEYAYGQWRSFENGTPQLKGTQNRVNASFHYNFF
jgi:hypothetical protein